MIDDRPKDKQLTGLSQSCGDRVKLLNLDARALSLTDKYDRAIRWANAAGIEWDAISIWDGDDSFMPKHLEVANQAFEDGGDYCYPSRIFTTAGIRLATEETHGLRCWSCSSWTRELHDRVGGFDVFDRGCGFDQRMVAKLRATCKFELRPRKPTYVYRWADTGSDHASGRSTGVDSLSWYDECPIVPAEPQPVFPQYDDVTEGILKEIELRFPEYL